MPTIELKQASCTCGSGKRDINIRQFRKDFIVVTKSTLRIWCGRTKCWVCKKIPVVGETWGISINNNEKNRLYCPECADDIEQKMAATELGVAETRSNNTQRAKCPECGHVLKSGTCVNKKCIGFNELWD
jgi:hypothetical protein